MIIGVFALCFKVICSKCQIDRFQVVNDKILPVVQEIALSEAFTLKLCGCLNSVSCKYPGPIVFLSVTLSLSFSVSLLSFSLSL